MIRYAYAAAAAVLACAPAQAGIIATRTSSSFDPFLSTAIDTLARPELRNAQFELVVDRVGAFTITGSVIAQNAFLCNIPGDISTCARQDIVVTQFSQAAVDRGLVVFTLPAPDPRYIWPTTFQFSSRVFTADQVETTFTLSAVPEPVTWAMMIGGLGLVGFRLRRSQSSSRPRSGARHSDPSAASEPMLSA